MKSILFLISPILLISFSCQAKTRSLKTSFYVTAAADYQMNGHDVGVSTNELSQPFGQKAAPGMIMKSKNNVGERLGLQLILHSKHLVFLSFGTAVKRVPQKLALTYTAAEHGFVGSSYTYNEDIKFTNVYLEYNFDLGFSFPINAHKNALECALGFVAGLTLNGRSISDNSVYGQANSSNANDLLFARQTQWGNENWSDLRPYFIGHLQLAYHLTPSTIFAKKSMRVGLDYYGFCNGANRNSTDLLIFSSGRSDLNKQHFLDAMTSLGIFVSIEL